MTENPGETHEHIPESFEYLIKEDTEITPDIVDQIKAFAKKEFTQYEALRQVQPPKDLYDRANAALLHNGSVDALNEYLGKYSVQLVMAKKNETVVGYGLSVIDPHETDEGKKVGYMYVGVAWDQQGKGIGKEVVKRQIEIFRNKQIKQFSTNVWDRSKGLAEQLSKELGGSFTMSKEGDADKITVNL